MKPQGKLVVVAAAASKTNGATQSGTFDTKGFDFVTIDVVAGTSNTTSNSPSVLTVTEGDNTSSFATWSGMVSGTDYTIPAANTSNPNAYKFNIDTKARKRYLRVAISPRTTQIIAIHANLFQGEEAPVNTTKANVLMLAEG